MKCPSCKEDTGEVKLEWHKYGRQTKCPKCGKKILISRFVPAKKDK